MYEYTIRPDEIYHYGIKRRSGRYPWGSGDRPYQGEVPRKIKTFEQATSIIMNNRYQPKTHKINDKKVELKIEENDTESDSRWKINEISEALQNKEKWAEDLTHDRIIEKGSTCYRSTSNENEQNQGNTYVSFDTGTAVEYATQDGIGNQVFKYKISKDIKIPSIETLSDTMFEILLSNDDVYNKSVNEYVRRNEKDIAFGAFTQHKKKKVKTGNDMLDYYHNAMNKVENRIMEQIINNPNEALFSFSSSILRGSSKNLGSLGSELVEKLKSKGYGGMPDLNDTSNRFKTPTFLFDIENTLSDKEKVNDDFRQIDTSYNVKYIK